MGTEDDIVTRHVAALVTVYRVSVEEEWWGVEVVGASLKFSHHANRPTQAEAEAYAARVRERLVNQWEGLLRTLLASAYDDIDKVLKARADELGDVLRWQSGRELLLECGAVFRRLKGLVG